MFSWISANLRKHFGFSKAETHGTLLLLLLTSACLLVPQGLKWYYSLQPQASHNQDVALLERTLALLASQNKSPESIHKNRKKDLDSHDALTSFDINTASEAQLSTIRGIGSVLSARILKFRHKLGGFISQAQYQEVYGLRPAVVTKLKQRTYICADFRPIKLDINTADASTLAAHPYLTYQQASSIVCYRARHGPFLFTEALCSLVLIDQATWEKLNPYLEALP